MITHSHYDRDTLARFLDEVEPPHDSDIAIHIEKCVECQTTMESLLGDGLTMEAAGALLRESAESLPADDFAWESTDSEHTAETAHRSFLDPSGHPNSLGRFARFEIMEILGRGGMGIVMRGYDTSLNRHSAVKVLAPELATSAAARKRFSREAKSAAAVVHPHVVPIHSVDEHNGLPYLVMPVVEGQSVDARVRTSGPVQVIEAVRIAAQVAEGLAAAHEQGLVHRDIKPANVLLENGVERVQITDLGLARAIDDASMTRSGVIAGTPQYMSPEQAHGDSIDHRSDLFSLGSLIYFMLTGHSPFRAETTMGVLNRIGNEQPRRLRNINADIPEWFESVVMKLLAKAPAGRFQSASEVAELLEGCLAHLQQPTITPLPEEIERLFPIVNRSQSVRDQSANHSRQWFYNWPPIGKFIATAAFAGALVFAAVLIVLELDKGTLTIESEADDIPIRIMQGDEVVKQLTVTRGDTSVRVASGNYVVVVDGEFSDIHVESGAVTLGRRETHAVRIIQSREPAGVILNAGEELFPRKTTGTLTPDQAKVHGFQRFIKLGHGQDFLGTSSVTVRFRVASVAKQIRYGDYSAWYLCPSEKPTEPGRGVLKIWIWPAVETALKDQGITDLEAHFVGKTVSVSGAVLSNPNPGPILYGGATPPWPRGGPENAAHSMELKSLDQLTVASPDTRTLELEALKKPRQQLGPLTKDASDQTAAMGTLPGTSAKPNQPSKDLQTSKDHFRTPESLMQYAAECQERDDVRGVVSCYSDEFARQFAASSLMLAGIMLQDFENNPNRHWSPSTPETISKLKKLLREQIASQSAATAATALGLATHDAMADKEEFGKSIVAGADAPMVQLLSAVTAGHLKNPREFIARFEEICGGDEKEVKPKKIFSYRITEQKDDTAIAANAEGNQLGLKRTENGWRIDNPYLNVPTAELSP